MARVKAKVDALILEHLLPTVSPIKEIALLYEMMRDYPERPAKGLRSLFCVTTCKALGGSEDDALLTAACIEILQNWILIHDDIEDGSELRRGRPALHRKYGELLAMNAGDALHARMWGVLLQNKDRLGADTALQVMEEFARIVNETTEGQHMELAWVVGRRWDLDESDYLAMVSRKTAWYSVAGPCRLGGLIAGAPAAELDRLREFGLKLGVGFQIQDDTLNLVGESSRYGKQKADDIREGKRSLILLKALKEAGHEDAARVTAIMQRTRQEKTDNDVNRVLALMKHCGAIAYAQHTAQQFLADALAVLDTIRWSGDAAAVQLLHDVARFSIERQW